MLSDDEFRQLLDCLDRPWSGYRKVRKGVKKRLRRHMKALACSSVRDYLHMLERNPVLRQQCEALLAITISRFFRDRRLWDYLQSEVLPKLAARFGRPLAAWSAGCANGEEPYSLSMVATAEIGSTTSVVRILATDANPDCLHHAQRGRYPFSSLKEMPEAFKHRWFEPVGRRLWQIDGSLGTSIRWKVHQLLAEPPREDFHIILLRNNLLTYYQGQQLQMAFDRIVGRLTSGGVLVIGSHERLPATYHYLGRDANCPWVYWCKRR
jgi:chemotaxis methyl-accepting protein methylase